MNIAVMASGSGSNFENLYHKLPPEDNIIILVYNKENCGAVKRANRLGIPSVYMKSKDEHLLVEYLKAIKIDLVVLAGYMRIIGDDLLQAYPNKIINIHPSLLPKYKGLNAIQQALDAKEEFAGATVHWVTKEMDEGPIILQDKVKIDDDDSVETLTEKIHKLEYKLLPKALEYVIHQI